MIYFAGPVEIDLGPLGYFIFIGMWVGIIAAICFTAFVIFSVFNHFKNTHRAVTDAKQKPLDKFTGLEMKNIARYKRLTVEASVLLVIAVALLAFNSKGNFDTAASFLNGMASMFGVWFLISASSLGVIFYAQYKIKKILLKLNSV